VLDASALWKWVRYYTNNWRVSPAQIQTVRTALAQCYWQGFIGWSELLRCERLLGKAQPNTPCDLFPANDLIIALSHIGNVVKDRYKIVDIQGFVDQGIIFEAHKGAEVVSVLCETCENSKTPKYTELHLIEGQPLSVWLMAQYPLGLPAPLANILLQQIYQLLASAKRKDEWIDSIHPGQFFINSDTFHLQHIPFASPVQPYMRGQMYLGESSGYRLIAIAYELYTGCVPGDAHQIHKVLKDCKNLQQWQKQQIEHCLSGKRSVSLTQAALILNANKKYVYRDTALLAMASVFAIAAIIWQGMNYAPELFTHVQNDPLTQTVVIEQDTKDKHVNLLKAAFFTQIEENNFAGAYVSWQALQKILPHDDIFIKKIGPELLATQVHEAPPLIMVESLPAADIVIPDIADEIVALPPLPKAAPSLEAIIEAVIKADPCEKALNKNNARAAACIDVLSNRESGPRLLATHTSSDKPLIVTEQTISVDDYNKYCKSSTACTPYETQALLDLELTEIESTVEDYNTYCLTSGLCEPLETSVESARALSPKEISHYAAWLSQETGYTYRLPTIDEWREMSAAFKTTSDEIEWVLDEKGELITTSKRRNQNENDISFRLVREKKS